MPIQYRSKLSSAIANQTFLDKTVDDLKKGKLGLHKVAPTDADAIDDVQQFINEIADTQGTSEGDATRKDYANENFISNGDSQKTTIEKLDAQMKINRDDIDYNDEFITELADTQGATKGDTDRKNYATNNVIADGDSQKVAIEKFDVQVKTNIDEIQAIEDSVNSPDGICPLDSSGKVPISNIPDSLLGAAIYQGTWNPTTNTPTLASGVGEKGHYYVCSTSGSTDLDGTTDWNAKDIAIFNGTIWEQIDNTDEVLSVFGRKGAVVAQSGDYTASQIGLGNVTNDAQLKRSAGDINTFTEKLEPIETDIVIIEDSSDSFSKKKVKLENMLGSGSGGGGGSFQWELGDIAPLEEFSNFMNVLSFESEIENSIFAMVTIPDSYKAGDQITLENALFFSDGASDNVFFKTRTTLLNIGGDASTTANQHISTNSEITLSTANELTSIGSLDLTDANGEINFVAVAPLDILIIEFYRDTPNETVNSTEYAKFIKYSASVKFKQ